MLPATIRHFERENARLREQVLHELFAMHALLTRLMRCTIPGQRAIVRIGGDGFY